MNGVVRVVELLQLKYFQKVAQLEHLSQAARELHITQPALSQTISKLERDVGVPLFNREGRQIRLNSYGNTFLKKVEIALTALEEGKREIIDMAGLERGRVSLDTTFIPHFPNVLNAFLTNYPDVHFDISQVSSKEMKEALLVSGEIDYCLSCHPIEQKGFLNIPIQTEDIVLVVPVKHRLANRHDVKLHEVADESFISFKKEHQFRNTTDAICQSAGFTPNIICETEESKIISDLVSSGLGIALLPESVLDNKNVLIHHLYIQEPVSKRTYYLSWKEERYLSLAAQTFREFLIEHFSNLQK